MLEVILKLPRQELYTKYVGSANSFLNLPIAHNEVVVGTIIEIISDDGDYVTVKGILFRSGTDYCQGGLDKELIPCSVTILGGEQI